MKEVCIPLPYLLSNENAEVEVKINSRNKKVIYRIESFPWSASQFGLNPKSEDQIFDSKIESLKSAISDYDDEWELLQIFAPEKSSDHIHVLYRKR